MRGPQSSPPHCLIVKWICAARAERKRAAGLFLRGASEDLMDDGDAVDRAWALMRKIGYCMLCTHDGAAIRARPMAAHVDRTRHAITFLTDVANHADDEITSEPQVCLAFADPHDQKYVAVTGRAAISNDRARGSRVVVDCGTRVVAQRRRAVDPRAHRDARGRPVLGQPRNGDDLREDAGRHRRRPPPRRRRARKGEDVAPRARPTRSANASTSEATIPPV